MARRLFRTLNALNVILLHNYKMDKDTVLKG